MMKIRNLALGVFISILTGCYIMKETGDKFISCYDGKQTGLDSLINTHGYYTMNYTMNKVYSYDINTKSIAIGDCMFFNDGFFIYYFDPDWNNGLYGHYTLHNDTIKAQYLYNPTAMNYGIQEVWFKIIDKKRIQWLCGKARTKITDYDVIDLRENKHYYAEPYKFIPVETLPNTDRFWLKRSKFFWCDKDKYKEFMAKVRREKIKKYNDFKGQ